MKVCGNAYTRLYQSNYSKKMSIFAHTEKYLYVAQNSFKPKHFHSLYAYFLQGTMQLVPFVRLCYVESIWFPYLASVFPTQSAKYEHYIIEKIVSITM